ncbi:tripartite-type tricarboxylate transporter receptor subunit TctC [Variovorax sp. Sphag1AA]|nr:tripartite-type tricarboxylate transporter receptor subunit TctC [Variovorax sp. Sphag1AA]
MKERMREGGAESMIMSPDEYDEFLKRDVDQMNTLIRGLGIQKQ